MRFRIFTSIVCIIALLAGFSSCILNEDKPQSDYHENYEDLEKYILNELGEYIRFEKPIVTSNETQINSEKMLTWHVVFLSEYSDNNKKNITPIEIVDRVRILYNDFVCNNADIYDSTIRTHLVFYLPSGQQYMHFAILSNYDCKTRKYLNHISTLAPYLDIADIYNKSDVEILDLCEGRYELDQIIEVADNMPQLRYIVVADKKTAEEASKLRPAVEFYYIKDYDYISQD